jgi:hypothetical protein
VVDFLYFDNRFSGYRVLQIYIPVPNSEHFAGGLTAMPMLYGEAHRRNAVLN